MGQVDLQQMTAARLSSMISTGEVFDERLLRSSFENEFCRILGIIDMNPLRGVERDFPHWIPAFPERLAVL